MLSRHEWSEDVFLQRSELPLWFGWFLLFISWVQMAYTIVSSKNVYFLISHLRASESQSKTKDAMTTIICWMNFSFSFILSLCCFILNLFGLTHFWSYVRIVLMGAHAHEQLHIIYYCLNVFILDFLECRQSILFMKDESFLSLSSELFLIPAAASPRMLLAILQCCKTFKHCSVRSALKLFNPHLALKTPFSFTICSNVEQASKFSLKCNRVILVGPRKARIISAVVFSTFSTHRCRCQVPGGKHTLEEIIHIYKWCE